MALKDVLTKGKQAFEDRGGVNALKDDVGELKNIATSKGSIGDKAKAAVEAVKDPGAKGNDSLPDKAPEGAGGPASAPGVTENVSPGLATEKPAADQPSAEVPEPAEPPVAPEPETPKAEVPEPAEPPVAPEPETPKAAPPSEAPLGDTGEEPDVPNLSPPAAVPPGGEQN